MPAFSRREAAILQLGQVGVAKRIAFVLVAGGVVVAMVVAMVVAPGWSQQPSGLERTPLWVKTDDAMLYVLRSRNS